MRPVHQKRKRTLRGDIHLSVYGLPQLQRDSEYPFEDGLALRPFCEDQELKVILGYIRVLLRRSGTTSKQQEP